MLAFARRRKGRVEWRFKRRFSKPELEGEGKKLDLMGHFLQGIILPPEEWL